MKKSKHNFQSSKSGTTWQLSLLFVLVFLTAQLGWSQTLGSFPAMNSGFEGMAIANIPNTAGTVVTGVQVADFNSNQTSNVPNVISSARTGSRALAFPIMTGTTITRVLQTATAAGNAVTSASNYTMQFYYRTGAVAPTSLTVGVSTDGSPTTSGNYVATTLAISNAVWTKKVISGITSWVRASGAAPTVYGMGLFRKTATSTTAAFDIDDYVIYQGAEDTTAPDAATTAIASSVGTTTQTISWTAPVAGVDNGGYMVVRGTVDPSTAPLVNGIYATTGTVAAGQTVVYIGTNPTFTDTGLSPSTNYFYRIYTVDKAYNYSTALTTSSATTAALSLAVEPTTQASNILFSNVTATSFDVSWTAGNGTSSIVVIKPVAVDGNPADSTTYTANTVFGSGSQLGSGNYVVFSGAGTSVSVTGLTKFTNYSVNVYSFNGTAGTENYLTASPGTAPQQTSRATISSANNAGTNAGASWVTPSSWTGGVLPTADDNVVIVTGDKIGVLSGQSCYNLTIQSGAKLYNNAIMPNQSGVAFLTVFGQSIVCDGVFNDKTGPTNTETTDGGLAITFNGNLTISGLGTLRPLRIRPNGTTTNASLIIDSNMELIFNSSTGLSGSGLFTENSTSNNITVTINSGKVLTFGPNSHFCTNATLTSNGKANTTININGTVNLPSTLNLRIETGKTCTLNVNGTLNVGNLNATSSSDTPGGAAPIINIGSAGAINVSGIADFSSTSLSGVVNGTGTFALNSGGTISIANASGLEPVAGSIRTTSRTFNTAANYSYVGTAAQVVGSDLPTTIGNLTLNNPAGLSLSNNLVTNTTTITAGTLSVPASNLTVTDVLTNNGTLTLGNTANLIQTNNVANTGSGTTTINRTSNALFRNDFKLWSSPVNGAQTLQGFSPQTLATRFNTYNSATNTYNAVAATSTFAAGTGYLIRMPDVLVPLDNDYDAITTTHAFPAVFTGTPNNGTVTVTVTNDTYNAVGNPYPSTISANAFITANSLVEALYFWRKKNSPSVVTSSYATYTTAGGVANSGDPAAIVPNGSIPVGQGFIAKSVGTTLVFNNAMRNTNSGTSLRTKQIERNRVWLNLSKDAAPVNQMMVAYMTGATAGVDAAIDGKPFNEAAVKTALNSLVNNEEYVIQGKGLPFDNSDVVALAFKAENAGNFTIAIDHVDGLFSSNQDVYLVDALNGAETNLAATPYNFEAEAGANNARFSLKFQKTLKVAGVSFDDSSVSVSKTNGILTVNSKLVPISNIKVYDLQGRLIAEKKDVKSNTAPVSLLKASSQVLIVKITGENKAVVTKKVLN
jgi:trimeric autotransporter adhesin